MICYDDELEEMICSKNLMNSYKLYFLKTLIVNTSNIKHRFDFKEMSGWMCAYSFEDVCRRGKRIRPLDKLYDSAVLLIERENLMQSSGIAEVYDAATGTDDKEVERAIKSLCNYVPYRLLAYLWPRELKGKTDRQKNEIIEGLSRTEERCMYSIYSISRDKKRIEMNLEWTDYIAANRKRLISWIDQKISFFVKKE